MFILFHTVCFMKHATLHVPHDRTSFVLGHVLCHAPIRVRIYPYTGVTMHPGKDRTEYTAEIDINPWRVIECQVKVLIIEAKIKTVDVSIPD